MTGKERILSAVDGQSTDRLPNVAISMMAAADIIGEPYKKYILDAKTHARGQIAFAQEYGIDHVSAISCPTTEAESLGADIIYFDDQPPAVNEDNALLSDKKKLLDLTLPDIGSSPRMVKRLETIRMMKEGIGEEKAIEGWIEGPMAESSDLRGINSMMMDLFDDPSFVKDLFAFQYEMAMAFAREQVKAGIDIMGIGDAAASLIGPELYQEYVMEYEKKYIDELHKMGVLVRLHICGNITPLLPYLKNIGADLLDLDSMVPIAQARKDCGPDQILCGNIEPVGMLRDQSPREIKEALEQCWQDAEERNYMIAAGCEIPRDTAKANLDGMKAFAGTHTLNNE